MAKVLIAGIGGGKKDKIYGYKKANYSIEEEGKKKIYSDRTFVTSAIEEHYRIDKTIYIGTTGSMWDELYDHYCKKYNLELHEDYYLSLAGVIEKANKNLPVEELDLGYFNEIFKGKVEGRVTHYGVNTGEIFENFNIIMNLQEALNDGDEVYIDITHSFRSNAVWMFLVLNYITDVLDKNIKVEMISYGMFEAQEDGVAPIVNLNAFYQLMKWIKGAQSFKNFGNSYPLMEVLEDENIKRKLKTFSDAMNMNAITSIKSNLKSLKKIMPEIEKLNGAGQLLIPKIVKDFIKQFDGVEEDYLLQARLAKWHFSQKRYAMAYININEAIVGYVADELNVDTDKARVWLWKLKPKSENKYFKMVNENVKLLEYYKISEHTRKVRNRSAHSLEEKDTAVNDVESLKKYCEKIEDMLTAKGFIYKKEQDLKLLD